MNKKILVFAGVFAATVSSMAFIQTAPARSAGGPVQGAGGQAGVASAYESSLNPAQEMLSRLLCGYQESFLAAASDSFVREGIILQSCISQMWLRTTPQQNYQKNVVYQLDGYRVKGGPWDQVRTAPSMVNALAWLNPEQEAQIKAVNAKHIKIFLDAVSAPGYRDGKTKVELSELASAREAAEAAEVYAVLTDAQKKEWDAIAKKAYASMEAAAHSSNRK